MPTPVSITPMDEHNRRLLDNVHPPQWRNPQPKDRYHLVVLGAGTAGLVTAAIGAALGAKLALVERYLLGGDCLNVGCVPSKAVIRCARAASQCLNAGAFGVRFNGPAQVDFAAVMERMRRLRSEISPNDSARRYTELGVDVFLGEAQFAGPDVVRVGDARLRFSKAVIATGARAAVPPIEGLAEAGFLTNETIFSLTRRPDDFVVIGGGPIGCELSQAFARLGCRVTLIEAGAQFLPREDPDAAAILRKAFERDGVAIRLGATTTRIPIENGRKQVHLDIQGKKETIPADEILIGVGRQPNVEGLDLEAAGVAYDPRRGVAVDDTLQTTNLRIFAAGDVCSKFKFTHTADFAARIVTRNALFPFLPKKKFSSLVIPWCTYTDPEIAHVGAHAKDLDAEGVPYEVTRLLLREVDRALLDGEEEGFLTVLTHAKQRGKILGATLIAGHAGEMISEITACMVHGIRLQAMGAVIHPYPTQAEAIRKAADIFNRSRLTPTRRRWLSRLIGMFS